MWGNTRARKRVTMAHSRNRDNTSKPTLASYPANKYSRSSVSQWPTDSAIDSKPAA
jgi:hypothetical protein